jgi:hypothetical protein
VTAGKVARGIGKWLLLVGALTIAFVVIVVIVVYVWAGSQNEVRYVGPEVQPAVFARIRQGDTEADVLRKIQDEPDSTDDTQVGDLTFECWYYGIPGEGGTYRFCFQNGRLASKSRTALQPSGQPRGP